MAPPAPLERQPPGAQPCPGCKSWVYVRTDERGRTLHLRWLADALTPDPTTVEAVRLAPVFLVHECLLLDKYLRAQKEERRRAQEDAEAAEQGLPLRLSPEEQRQHELSEAQRFACPQCKAPVGEPCINIRQRTKGVEVHTRWPHESRSQLVWDARAEQVFQERERQRAQALVTVESFVCPKCSAEIGQRCINLTSKRHGEDRPTNWPHAERELLAQAACQQGTNEQQDQDG